MIIQTRQIFTVMIAVLSVTIGCSRQPAPSQSTTADSAPNNAADATLPVHANDGPLSEKHPDTSITTAAKARDITWIIASENQPVSEIQSKPAGEFLSVQSGTTQVSLPQGAADHHVIWNQPLSDDFEVKVKLRWPDWDANSGSPRVRFGLCSELGQMQKFSQKVWFTRKRKEFYDIVIRCSGGGVGLTFDDKTERGFAREFDGTTFFAFVVDAPAQFEIVDQSVTPGQFAIKFSPTRTINVAGGFGGAGMAPPGVMPPGMVPSGMVPPGMVPPGMVPPGMVPPGMVPPGMVPPGMVPRAMTSGSESGTDTGLSGDIAAGNSITVAGGSSSAKESLPKQMTGPTPLEKEPTPTPKVHISATREWSDSTGKFKVQATFIRLDSKIVVLKKEDGQLAKVPLDRLSVGDQQAVAQLAGDDSGE